MKNLIILILAIIIIGGGAYYYFNYVKDSDEGGINMPNIERRPLDTDKDDGKNVGDKKIPDLSGKFNAGNNCEEGCDNSCENKQEDCADDCQDDYDDDCKDASDELAGCNHNCQFVPIPPGPALCFDLCKEGYEKICDEDEMKDCKKDCTDKENICLEDCYGDC